MNIKKKAEILLKELQSQTKKFSPDYSGLCELVANSNQWLEEVTGEKCTKRERELVVREIWRML